MDFKDERGSATIEGAILFPIILIVFFGLVLLIFQVYNSFCVTNSLGQALRVSGYGWYEDKKLYDDIIYDFNSSKVTSNKFKKTSNLYSSLLRPTFKENTGTFTLDNYVLYRRLVGKAGLAEGSYPVFRGAMFIRSSQYLKEMLEDTFSHLKENMRDEDEVYIVDENYDDYEYNRVYHLYSDCSYLKNGYKAKTTLGEGRDKGFRVCRICLARKTGMD
ncbi:MAG: hypothetical protein FD141_498 [Fusobacteria bacterium]|nr:MAG: hypothetical protein FD141_498 [Fusobacteriota bacterium]KAF0228837.1 MAG: hypothetical protein FD182_1093 [Fusobacteriota bacterium]